MIRNNLGKVIFKENKNSKRLQRNIDAQVFIKYSNRSIRTDREVTGHQYCKQYADYSERIDKSCDLFGNISFAYIISDNKIEGIT